MAAAESHDHDLSSGFDDVVISGDDESFSRLICSLEVSLGHDDDQLAAGAPSQIIPPPNSTFKYDSVSLPFADGSSDSKPLNKKKKRKRITGRASTAAEALGGGDGGGGGGGGSVSSVKRKKANKRRQRLGQGIVTLQQLVCPYGKTDAASVLHEAMGYVRFLQEQVKVLCLPYLQCQHPPSECQPFASALLPQHDDEGSQLAKWSDGLRSKGLCLVPVECIAHIMNNNGADLWAPAPMINTAWSA